LETPALYALRNAVTESDRWSDYVGALAPERPSESLTFTFTDGANGRCPERKCLRTRRAHGGYHRGAVGRFLSQASVSAPRDIFTVYLHKQSRSSVRDPDLWLCRSFKPANGMTGLSFAIACWTRRRFPSARPDFAMTGRPEASLRSMHRSIISNPRQAVPRR
jgi:hypothetical protein